MRLSPIVIIVALLASAGVQAQQSPGESSGIGPGGRGSVPPGTNQDKPPATRTVGCADPTFAGKYSEELRRLELPNDRGRYGACNDYGAWSGTSYAGHTGLPRGYWVYSYPYWIIYAKRQ